MIELGILRIDLDKVKVIEEQPTLEKLKDIRGFLRFTNFYRSLIKGYEKIVKPLTDLTRKEEGFKWDIAQKDALHYLKKVIIDEPIVIPANLGVLFEIEIDTSKDIIRVTLI